MTSREEMVEVRIITAIPVNKVPHPEAYFGVFLISHLQHVVESSPFVPHI